MGFDAAFPVVWWCCCPWVSWLPLWLNLQPGAGSGLSTRWDFEFASFPYRQLARFSLAIVVTDLLQLEGFKVAVWYMLWGHRNMLLGSVYFRICPRKGNDFPWLNTKHCPKICEFGGLLTHRINQMARSAPLMGLELDVDGILIGKWSMCYLMIMDVVFSVFSSVISSFSFACSPCILYRYVEHCWTMFLPCSTNLSTFSLGFSSAFPHVHPFSIWFPGVFPDFP